MPKTTPTHDIDAIEDDVAFEQSNIVERVTACREAVIALLARVRALEGRR